MNKWRVLCAHAKVRKSQTCPGTDVIIFSVNVLCGGLQKGITVFRFLELRAPNSSMAFSYERFSVSPYHRDLLVTFDRTHGAWVYGIIFGMGLASHHLGPWPIKDL